MAMSQMLALERDLLSGRLQHYLNDLQPVLRADVLVALEVEGKLLHRPASVPDGRWALTVFCLARDLNADVDREYACKIALAIECLVCATDLFDDAMDEDVTPLMQRLGLARMLNVALTLVSLVPRLVLAGGPAVSADFLTRMLETLHSALLLASTGQQRDLLAEKRLACALSREECLEIAAEKAGTLLSLACRLSAMCAGAGETQVDQCAELGRLLGIAAQLDNDAHGLSLLLLPLNHVAGGKSDLVRGKKTLPVVLAAHSLRTTQALDAVTIDTALHRLHSLPADEKTIYVRALREGILATWGIALLYRERARDCLRTLEQCIPLSPVSRQILGLHETLPAVKEQ